MKKIWKLCAFLPALFMMGVIFSFSAQTGTQSGSLSHDISVRVVETKGRFFHQELEKKEIEKQLLRQTDTLVKLNLWEKQLDLTNSYYRLGGYRRELYEIYQSDRTAYANDLTLDISYNITPVLE